MQISAFVLVLYPGTTNRIGSSGFSTRAAPNSRQFIVRGRGRAAYNNNANNNNNSQFNNNSAIRNVSGSSINKSVTNTIHSSQPYGRGRSQVLRRRPKRSHSRSRSRSRSRSSSRSRSRLVSMFSRSEKLYGLFIHNITCTNMLICLTGFITDMYNVVLIFQYFGM